MKVFGEDSAKKKTPRTDHMVIDTQVEMTIGRMEKARPFANKNIFMYCICFEVFDQYAPENGK